MPCISPPQLETRELLAYLAGEAGPGIAAHLADCPACRSRAEALAGEDRRLIGILFRAQCPSADDLVDLAEGSLDPGRRPELARHVAGCPLCQRDQAAYAAFMALPDAIPAAADLPQAISATPARPVDLAVTTRSSEPAAPSRLSDLTQGLRILVANLVGGVSGGGAAGLAPAWAGAGGLRGDAGSGEGVYSVEAEDIRISLAVEPDDAQRGRRIVSGTLAGLPAAEAAVWLAAGDAVVARGAVGSRGYFELDGVPAGRYSLTVILPDAAVQIHEVEV